MNSLDMTPEQMQAKVEIHLNALMEFFDCVQILVSTYTPKGTDFVRKGAGNWFARQGMAQDFINTARAETEAAEIARVLPHQDGD